MQEHNNLATENSNQATDRPIQLQPMSFTDILDGMFTLYRNHFRLFLEIVLVYFVLEYVIDKVIMFFTIEYPYEESISVLILPLLINTLLAILIIGALCYASAQVFLGRNITAKDALKQTLQRFLPFLGTNIIYTLVVSVLFITCIGIPFAIYLSVRWGLYSLPVLFEETRIMTSLRRSTELVKGTWWRVCGIMLALFLIHQMIQSILGNSFGIIFFFITGVEGVADGNPLDAILRFLFPTPLNIGWLMYMIRSFVMLSITALAMPIAAIGSTLLYFDLRIRKEAYDIEMRATDE